MLEGRTYQYYIDPSGVWHYIDMDKPVYYGMKMAIHSSLSPLEERVGTVGTYDCVGFQFHVDGKWLFIPWDSISYLEQIVEVE